jgi:hypothetical protein
LVSDLDLSTSLEEPVPLGSGRGHDVGAKLDCAI